MLIQLPKLAAHWPKQMWEVELGTVIGTVTPTVTDKYKTGWGLAFENLSLFDDWSDTVKSLHWAGVPLGR